MIDDTDRNRKDLHHKLVWLILARLVFSCLLLGSTILLHVSGAVPLHPYPLRLLYAAVGGVFVLSAVFSLLIRVFRRIDILAYIQILIDTLIISLLVYITGSSSSVFVFLYLVVVIYTSMILYRRGSFVIAGACTIEFAALAACEYWGALPQIHVAQLDGGFPGAWQVLVYRVLITAGACFSIAFLSSRLSEQARRTRGELMAMEAHCRRVEKMAAVGEMGAGLAHEIKNPLASITGAIQMLREEVAYDPGTDKLMQITLREADRLSTLVNNFLLFARPPKGKREPVAMDNVIAEMIALFRQSDCCRERIHVGHRGEVGLWTEMDLDHFKQVLWNLLVNAAEAIQEEGTIEVEHRSSPNGSVLVRISDTGCGMAPENLDLAFDPFFTTKPKGTGLGLSIVHRIVESYQGSLDLHSRPGEGTTVGVRLRSIPPPGGLDNPQKTV